MAKKTLNYFLKRSLADEEAMHRGLDGEEDKIIRAYSQAQDYLNKRVSHIYKRYLNKSGLSEEEVKKVLNTTASATDLAELQRLSQDIQSKELKKDVADYLTGVAVKYRITLLEDLKAKAYVLAKQIADVELEVATDFYIDTIHEAHDQAAAEAIMGKAETVAKIDDTKHIPKYVSKKKEQLLEIHDNETGKVVKTINLTTDTNVPEFKELSAKYVKNILESEWKGSNYSKRIWNDTELLAKRLEELFTVKNMTGMSEKEMTDALAKEFDTSKYVARRLVRTEANYFAGQAKLKGWKEHGVEKYMIVAVLDMRTSQICRHMDGKIFNIEDAVVNETYVPFHVFCRSVAVAYFGKRTLDGMRTANDPLTNKTFEIDQRTNYKEWEQLLIKKHSKEEVLIARKKAKNFNSDLKQFNRYKSTLKGSAPNTLDDFQSIKYGDKIAYNELKKRYMKAR